MVTLGELQGAATVLHARSMEGWCSLVGISSTFSFALSGQGQPGQERGPRSAYRHHRCMQQAIEHGAPHTSLIDTHNFSGIKNNLRASTSQFILLLISCILYSFIYPTFVLYNYH